MKKLLLIALLLSACTSHSWSGKVTDKEFEPASDDLTYGFHCGPGLIDFKMDCNPKLYTDHKPNRWTLYIYECNEEDKCRNTYVRVGQQEYESTNIGDSIERKGY